MPVDSYRWLPRSLQAYYRALPISAPEPTSWTPLRGSIADATIAFVTTAGIHLDDDEPFDMDRERREPAWGDPSVREVPADVPQDRIAVSHLHYNTDDVLADVDCVFPIHRARELAAAGVIGDVAARNYSFMGFQLDQTEQLRVVDQVVEQLKRDEVDAVFLTPA